MANHMANGMNSMKTGRDLSVAGALFGLAMLVVIFIATVQPHHPNTTTTAVARESAASQ